MEIKAMAICTSTIWFKRNWENYIFPYHTFRCSIWAKNSKIFVSSEQKFKEILENLEKLWNAVFSLFSTFLGVWGQKPAWCI